MQTLQIEKSYAIQCVNNNNRARSLTNQNTHFSNINASKNVWWLDIPLEKINSDRESSINILLYEYNSASLFLLVVPKTYFREHISSFVCRNEKKVISLELSADTFRLFQDVRPTSMCLPFAQFLRNSLKLVNFN